MQQKCFHAIVKAQNFSAFCSPSYYWAVLKIDILGPGAAEHGVAATVRFYVQKLPDHVLRESSVRTWRNAYTRDADK